MYFKLVFRNVRRSGKDYFIYMVTMILLIGIMTLSKLVSIVGNKKEGFETDSLPILISIIMVVLFHSISGFILKQRAREFATYLLLGMKKNRLAWMFGLESFILGCVCFIFGIITGGFLFTILQIIFRDFTTVERIPFVFFIKAFIHTGVFFCIIEMLSLWGIRRIIKQLEIRQLMVAKRQNQTVENITSYKLWFFLCVGSFLLCFALLLGIVYLPENISMILLSFLSIPLIALFFAFYKALFYYGTSQRREKAARLYKGNRLYIAGQILSSVHSNATKNSILSICLFFSSCAFVFGWISLQNVNIMNQIDRSLQYWMGFLQICICVIFIIIYFAVLSVQQIIDIQKEYHNIKVLHYLGKTTIQLKKLIAAQICLKLVFPVILCIILLAVGSPFVNYKVNLVLDASNLVSKGVIGFFIFFIILYILYFFIVYQISKKAVIAEQK